jgi:hypothetical protein
MLRLLGRTTLQEWQERCTARLSSTLQSHRQDGSASSNYGFSEAGAPFSLNPEVEVWDTAPNNVG